MTSQEWLEPDSVFLVFGTESPPEEVGNRKTWLAQTDTSGGCQLLECIRTHNSIKYGTVLVKDAAVSSLHTDQSVQLHRAIRLMKEKQEFEAAVYLVMMCACYPPGPGVTHTNWIAEPLKIPPAKWERGDPKEQELAKQIVCAVLEHGNAPHTTGPRISTLEQVTGKIGRENQEWLYANR